MRKRNAGCLSQLVLICVIAVLGIAIALHLAAREKKQKTVEDLQPSTKTSFSLFLEKHGLTSADYPQALLDLLASNPEAEDFVLNYPLLKNKTYEIDLSTSLGQDTTPLFIQWDKRWGYREYGDSVMGVSGCGPTCLSMVAIHLLGEEKMDPGWIADFSTDNGFCVPGNGTAWALMSEGAEKLGLKATELPLDKGRILQNLEAGNPIICIMGPGHFTTTGHYIVLTGCTDGKISVNDPNSYQRSQQLWTYESFCDEIRNLWVYTA